MPFKHGLMGLPRQLAVDWAGQGAGVNCIAPGLIQKHKSHSICWEYGGDTYVKHQIRAGRINQLREIGGSALFLASDAASFINVQTIIVDGETLFSQINVID